MIGIRSSESIDMNWDQIAGNWKQMTGRLRQEWSKLSESDIDNAKGNRDSLIGKIQERYGVARDEAERQLREWEHKLKS